MSANISSGGAIGRCPIEVVEEILEYLIISPKDLRLRLVCRGFFHSSEKHYIAQLQNVVFDIRSPDSLRALTAISEIANVASVLTKLNFVCNYEKYHDESVLNTKPEDRVYLQPYMSHATFQKWQMMRDENKRYFGTAFDPPSNIGHLLIGTNLDQVASHVYDRDKLTNYLAEAVSKFKNVREISILESRAHGSQRYNFVLEDVWRLAASRNRSPKPTEWFKHDPKFEVALERAGIKPRDFYKPCHDQNGESRWGWPRSKEESSYAHMGALTGFDILMRAIHRAGVSPLTMAFPCHKLDTHGFATFAPKWLLQELFKDTMSLRLRPMWHCYQIFQGETYQVHGPVSQIHADAEILFTQDNFPSLKHLAIDCDNGLWLDSDVPSPDEVVHLDSFTFRYTSSYPVHDDIVTTHPDFLNHFAPYLKKFTAVNVCYGNWNPFLRELGKSRLEKLEVKIEPEVWNFGVKDIFQCVQELFEGAAIETTIEPGEARERVEQIWMDHERAIDDMLDDDEEELDLGSDDDEDVEIDQDDEFDDE